jgi:type IV fimbrial biogenesis protein FimT
VSRDNPASACGVDYSESVAPRIIQKKVSGDGSANVAVAAVDINNAATSCITFNGFGRLEAVCSDVAASIPLARVVFASSQAGANTRTLEVRVSAGGVIRMCDPAVLVATDPRVC